MIQPPKSLTATVHVRFHYREPEVSEVGESQTQMLNKILDSAHEMDPAMQELLLKFSEYLSNLGRNEGQRSD